MKQYDRFSREDDRVPIITGSGIITQDASVAPITSPATIGVGTTTINVPSNAAEMVLNPDSSLKISEASNMAHSFATSSPIIIPLGNTDQIFLTRGGGVDVTLNFYFVTV